MINLFIINSIASAECPRAVENESDGEDVKRQIRLGIENWLR